LLVWIATDLPIPPEAPVTRMFLLDKLKGYFIL